MRRYLTPAEVDDVIEGYKSGKTVPELARIFGVSASAIHRKVQAAGIVRKRGLTGEQVAEAVRRYQAGETQGEIAASLGIAQGSLSRHIIAQGEQIGRGEAMRRRLASMSRAERLELTSAAHDAVRGAKRSDEDLIRRALGKQASLASATDDERAIADAIGVPVVLQEAIGKYNVDIGIAPIAVELFGGGWHAHGRHRARLPQRIKDIADTGRNQLIIWTHAAHPLTTPAVAEDVLAYLEISRSDPAFRRRYRVIWGDGQFLAAGCVDDDQLTLVPTGIRGAYAKRG